MWWFLSAHKIGIIGHIFQIFRAHGRKFQFIMKLAGDSVSHSLTLRISKILELYNFKETKLQFNYMVMKAILQMEYAMRW